MAPVANIAARTGMTTHRLVLALWLVTLATVAGLVIALTLPDQAAAGIALIASAISAGTGYVFGHGSGYAAGRNGRDDNPSQRR